MQGDLADNIPLLLLAEEENEVDKFRIKQKYGILSAFKVKVAVLSLDSNPGSKKTPNHNLPTGTVMEEEFLELSSIH